MEYIAATILGAIIVGVGFYLLIKIVDNVSADVLLGCTMLFLMIVFGFMVGSMLFDVFGWHNFYNKIQPI